MRSESSVEGIFVDSSLLMLMLNIDAAVSTVSWWRAANGNGRKYLSRSCKKDTLSTYKVSCGVGDKLFAHLPH